MFIEEEDINCEKDEYCMLYNRHTSQKGSNNHIRYLLHILADIKSLFFYICTCPIIS